MTPLQTIPRNVPASTASVFLPQMQRAISVCWIAQSGGANGLRRFVLSIEPESNDHALVEAWVEHAQSRQTILHRQRLAIHTSISDQVLHIDLLSNNSNGNGSGGGHRLAMISLYVQDESPRLLLAQTSLLEKAGFNAGGYDPPRLNNGA